MLTVAFKFAPGDKVYAIAHNEKYSERVCPSCAGVASEVLHDGQLYICKTCEGQGVIEEATPIYHVEEAVISACCFDYDNDGAPRILYAVEATRDDLDNPGMGFLVESNVYSTSDEVHARIDELDKEQHS